jgi:hypothetical protein
MRHSAGLKWHSAGLIGQSLEPCLKEQSNKKSFRGDFSYATPTKNWLKTGLPNGKNGGPKFTIEYLCEF